MDDCEQAASGAPSSLSVRDNSAVPRPVGDLIRRTFREIIPDTSIEVGFAAGVSTLYACEALHANGKPSCHIVIDPYQSTHWRNSGVESIRRAGYARFVELHEEGSEIALPRLLSQGVRVQAAIIDGFHTFDHALLDFFYINKMLDVGGAIIFDDTNMPSVGRVVRHVLTYPAYEPYRPVARSLRGDVRRMVARVAPALRRGWDNPRAVVVRKVANDMRDWNWDAKF